MLTIKNTWNDTKYLKKLDLAISSGWNEQVEFISWERIEIWNRFLKRFSMWQQMFQNIENANKRNFIKYSLKWLEQLDVQQKIEFDPNYDRIMFIRTNSKKYDENLKFYYPFSAFIKFYNKLAEAFYRLGLWNNLINLVYRNIEPYAKRISTLFGAKRGMKIFMSWELSNIYGNNLKPYHLPVFTSADLWFFCVSECLYYALGGYSYLSIFKLDGKLDSKSYIDSFKILFKAIDAGLGNFEVYKDIIIIKSVPKFKTNLDGQIHCDNGPALKNINGEYEYYYENVKVSEKIILHPKLITISDILNEKNQSVRNVMIERYGLEKFLNDLKYEIIDSCSNEDGESQLLKVKLNEIEPMMLVKVICPSTKRYYFLRVPPDMKTVKEAIAWTFNLTESQYKPIQET
jgi:hypothetical protein